MEAVIEHNNGHERQIISLSQDSFYRELTEDEGHQAIKGNFNFDHPGKANLQHLLEPFEPIINPHFRCV